MFASVRFLLLVSTFVTSISLGAPLDVKQSGDVGKDKPTAPEEKGGKGGYEPPPPVVTEHTLTLPDGKVLNYKAITGYLLIRDTKQENQPEKDSGKESGKEGGQDQLDPSRGKPKAQIFFVAPPTNKCQLKRNYRLFKRRKDSTIRTESFHKSPRY